MALASRCRSHVGALLRRSQLLASSSAPSISRRLEPVCTSELCPCSSDPWLNPSYGGSSGMVRQFSWWSRGGGGQVENAGAVAPIQHEDQAGESAQEHALWERKVDMEEMLLPEVVEKLHSDEVVEGGSVFWSTLQVPTDAIIVTLDQFQHISGVPWWLTIIGSTLALRAALFPLTVTQLQKASLLARLGSQLPPPVPRPGSGQTLASQYRIFTQRRLELGAPSPAWLIAVPLIQVPLFIYWIVAVRQMAMASHPGFDTGGILWFTDLTVPVQGALGALFPIIVAATYFTNLQLSFKGIEQQTGIMGTVMKFYKWWLEAATIPSFIFGFYLPQGVFMYWITNNCCSLAQTIALRQQRVRAALGLPSLAELSKLRSSSASPSPLPTPPPSPFPESGALKMEAVENMSSDDLLVLAATCVSMQKEDEALEVLHHTVKKFPDKVEALYALGKIYSQRQLWSEASEYHGLVLQKTKEKELVIAASLGAGVALFNLGKRSEALEIMSVFTEMEVPQDALSQHRYFKACIALSSVLSQEGRKLEALKLLRKAAKYEPMVEKVFIPQLEKELEQES